MSFGSLWVITINWIWEVKKETIIMLAKLINMKKTWGEGGPFPAYILQPQLPLSAISTDLWPRFASQIVDTNVLYLLSPITSPFDFFCHFSLVGLTLCSSSWSSSGSRWHWWTGRAGRWGLRSRERQIRWKPQPLVDVMKNLLKMANFLDVLCEFLLTQASSLINFRAWDSRTSNWAFWTLKYSLCSFGIYSSCMFTKYLAT